MTAVLGIALIIVGVFIIIGGYIANSRMVFRDKELNLTTCFVVAVGGLVILIGVIVFLTQLIQALSH